MLLHTKRKIIACMVGGLVTMSAGVMAAKYPELNKKELSDVRGKFVSSNQIAYFGITMHTLWKMPSGTHRVGLRLEADLTQALPQFRFRHGGTLGEQSDENSSLPEPPKALTQVEGSVQSIQMSSNHNRVYNNVAISVAEQSTEVAMESSAPEAMPELTTTSVVQQNLPQTQTYESAATGATTQFNQSGSLGYSIATEAGLVVQRIGGPDMARQLIQSVQLGRDANTIINDVKLRVEFNQGQNLRNDVRRINNSLFGLR